MTTIHADEVRPGDVIVHAGHPHQIVQVDRHEGWAWPIASDGTGWAIALGHQPVAVLRPAA